MLPATTDTDPGFEALLAEARARLPAYAPEWTNHNVSDPGITLVELLAYFTDALQYRLGRVAAASGPQMLRLLRGEGPVAGDWRAALEAALDDIAQVDCAVTAADHERLALQAIAGLPSHAGVRVRCLPDTDFRRSAEPGFDQGQDPGHVTVVVFAAPGTAADHRQALLRAVHDALDARRLLTCRLHVVPPQPVWLGLRVWAWAAPGADPALLARRLADALAEAPDEDAAARGAGTLSLAEMADRAGGVDGVEGVDGVALLQAALRREALGDPVSAVGLQVGWRSTVGRDSRLGAAAAGGEGRLLRNGDGELGAVRLRPWEAPRLVLRPEDVIWNLAP